MFSSLKNYLRFQKIKNKDKLIIFFSEGFSSWLFIKYQFKNLIENNRTIYITSSFDEYTYLIKKYPVKKLNFFYCGTKSIRTIWLNSISANSLITTIPDLNLYHWKRSPFVKKYCYLFHSLGSTTMIYNNKAFDSYDVIYCCTDYQYKELSYRKKKLNLHYKLYKSGYNHLDYLIKNSKENLKSNQILNILIAPTWSINEDNSYLVNLIKILSNQKNLYLILRFHPMNKEHSIKKIEHLLTANVNVDDCNNYSSYFKSDILITDWSTASIEYSMGLLKPSIHINTKPKIRNKKFNLNEIDQMYEKKFRNLLGIEINISNINELNYEYFLKLINDDERILNMKLLRNKHVYNISESNKVLEKQILNEIS